MLQVVYIFNPTPNHNRQEQRSPQQRVVYIFNPTPNHNKHQQVLWNALLFISSILHQTTTDFNDEITSICCLYLQSYTKPQQSQI